jgi:uncharacterized membrane protein YphA (DoxX/SURF4 family)
MSIIKTLGHAGLASMFISGGASAFAEPGGRVQRVEAAGIPQPRQATILNGAIMTVAGTTLAFGIFPKLSALALIGTLIPTTLVGHSFWAEESEQARAMHLTQFYKNTAMLGGLLMVLAEKD